MTQLSKTAFDQLFREHYSGLVQFANCIFKDQSRSEDVVQDLFLDLWRKRAQLTEVQSYSAYLRRAVKNKTFDQLRKEKRRPIIESDEQLDQGAQMTLSIEDELISQEKVEFIQQVIHRLPEKRRTVFIMSRREGMTYKDIAETLDVSTKTVEYHMMQSLKFLREALFLFMLIILF
mgnify:CR=1 FL=1